MDIRGQFVNRDGLLGIVAALTDVGFSTRHNFILLSVTSLWQQSWSVGGRTRHVDVRMYSLRELKDDGLIVIRHISGDDNDADIFTKNTTTAVFNKHVLKFIGNDEYLQDSEDGEVETPK
jgi:hypothetical protein